MREVGESDDKTREPATVFRAGSGVTAPKTVPRVDYERIFVLDTRTNLLGEYALNDECPLESSDLMRSLPLSGMRHLVSFYQGEYAFTPFKVDDLWFVILTHGVPRIEERGSVGTLLAAARIHVPPMIEPLLAKREIELRAREQEVAQRESDLARRELRAAALETELGLGAARLREMEADIRSREAKLDTLRDYAVQLQRNLVPAKDETAKESVAPRPRSSAT